MDSSFTNVYIVTCMYIFAAAKTFNSLKIMPCVHVMEDVLTFSDAFRLPAVDADFRSGRKTDRRQLLQIRLELTLERVYETSNYFPRIMP
jgi:hypothetical protein